MGDIIGDLVLRLLSPPLPDEYDTGRLPLPPTGVVLGPDDHSDSDGNRSEDEQDKHVTEVFLPGDEFIETLGVKDCVNEADDFLDDYDLGTLPPVPDDGITLF